MAGTECLENVNIVFQIQWVLRFPKMCI